MTDKPELHRGPHTARMRAQPFAEEVFNEAERRFAYGTPFEAAKRAVLEERIPAIAAEEGEAVVECLIQAVMEVPVSATHPAARKAYGRRRWKALVTAHVEAGGTPPSRLEVALFKWLGLVPKRLRA